jgi:hypothetical protein
MWASSYSVKAGDVLEVDAGFSCITKGTRLRVERVGNGDSFFDLYVPCSHGKHYLSGQQNPEGELVGFIKVAS